MVILSHAPEKKRFGINELKYINFPPRLHTASQGKEFQRDRQMNNIRHFVS